VTHDDACALEAFSHIFHTEGMDGARLVLASDWLKAYQFESYQSSDAVTLFGAIDRPALPDGLRELIAKEARKTDPLPVGLALGLLLGVAVALVVGRR
jgi:hypothetical protein